MPLEMREDRSPIREALDTSIVVEAAAGTGKTTELVARVVRLIESGRAEIGRIVAVTFGEKAAGELKLRIREELERARTAAAPGSEQARLLSRAVYDFEDAHVTTIHGFCAELLRERPVEACVDPAFAVLTETQSDALFDEVFGQWLQRQLDDPGEGVRRSLRRASRWQSDDEENGPVERLRRAARELREWRDYTEPWQRPGYDRRAAIDGLIARLESFAAVTARPLKRGDNFAVDTLPAHRVYTEIQRARRVGAEDYDGWEALLVSLVDATEARSFREPRKGSGAAFAEGCTRQAAHDAHAQLLAALQAFRRDADAELASCLRDEMADCLEGYEARKRALGSLDFLDLLIKARDLVRDADDVRRRFQERFTAILVDEFQDTDPLQAELLMLLARDEARPDRMRPGALFIVGDPKQSIYRFRRADVGVFRRISARLEADGARRVQLQTSYRSVPEIQRFVNAAFRAEMNGDERSLQATYVPLKPSRADEPAQPAIVALPVPRPYGMRKVTLEKLKDQQPNAIGQFVEWLLSPECRWTADAPHPADPRARTRRALVPSDICLLFRRFLHYGDDVTRAYVEALEARGIPHLLVGGKTFHEREEIDAVRAALMAIEWPEDELSVYATLRGPLFAIGEEELFEYRGLAHAFHPFRVAQDLPPRLAPIAEALNTLRTLHSGRNYRPVADTIGRLLEATRAHAGLVLWRGGEQVLANVLHVSDLARRYEGEGGLSFRGFVDMLREAAGKAQAPEAPILEEGSEGVRLMTVHKAKGLEFPVVILADIGCRLSQRDASRYLDPERRLCAIQMAGWSPVDLLEHNDEEALRDEAEGVRLAYVAATRARDLLVVPAIGDEPFEGGWVRPLNRALYPPVSDRQEPRQGPGCPAFRGKDTVLERPDGQQPDERTVRPGAYSILDDVTGEPFTVVWWDPLLLDVRAPDTSGLRRDDLISKDARPEHVAEDRSRYEEWRAKRTQVQETASRPSLRVLTATEWVKGRPPEIPSAANTENCPLLTVGPLTYERPSGKRFGILVHAVLAAVPLDADAVRIRDVAALHARLLGSTDVERDEAAAIAGRVLQHEIMQEARAAAAAGRTVRREAPITIVADGVLIDGQIDLAYETEGGWRVVDFKTDAEIGLSEDVYREQVALYCRGLSAVTGRQATGVLLRV